MFVGNQQAFLAAGIQMLLYDRHMNNTAPDLSTYSGRLKYAMTLSGMTNQSELAGLVGVSPQTIQHLANKGKGSTHNSKIAAILDVDPEWLAYGKGTPRRIVAYDVERPQNVTFVSEKLLEHWPDVPLLTSISAGKWIHHHGAFTREDAERWLPCPIAHSPMAFVMKVDGHSMTSPHASEKSYPHGTYAYFEPEKPFQNGSMVAAFLKSAEAITFKQYVEDAGRRYLRPLNPGYKDIPIEDDDIEIIGVLIGAFSPA